MIKLKSAEDFKKSIRTAILKHQYEIVHLEAMLKATNNSPERPVPAPEDNNIKGIYGNMTATIINHVPQSPGAYPREIRQELKKGGIEIKNNAYINTVLHRAKLNGVIQRSINGRFFKNE